MFPRESRRTLIAAAAAALLLAGCGSGPVKRINPPTASIQQLVVDGSGTWRLTLRIQNFSTVPMVFGRLDATVKVDGTEVGTLALPLGIDVVGNSAEVVEATLPVSARLPTGDFAYELTGHIDVTDPKKVYPFDRSSRLTPVPGLPGTWR